MIRPNVLLIIPNLGNGGAQRVFHQQRQHLSSHFNVTCCVFNWDGAFKTDYEANIISLDVPAGNSVFGKFYYLLLRIVRLRRLKEKSKIDVSISHLEGADYVNLLSPTGDKVICWIHGTKKFDQKIKGYLGWIRKTVLMPLLYRRANSIVTVSRGIEDELKSTIKNISFLLKTVYNGFDTQSIESQKDEPVDDDFVKMASKSKTIITHCRLSEQKNLTSLICIFKNLIKDKPSKLLIIGDGELREHLLNECKTIGLKVWSHWQSFPLSDLYDVYFLGYQQNPFKYIKHASVYALTSSWEGFPLALGEAMICGLPVIASDCYTGPREILASELNQVLPITKPYYSKFGVLMPMVDRNNSTTVGEWVDQFQIILNDDELSNRLAENGRVHIKNFDLKNVIQQTVQLIKEQKA